MRLRDLIAGIIGAVVTGILMGILGVIPRPPQLPPPIPQPPPPIPQPPPPIPPDETKPDAFNAIVRISSGNVGCSLTVIGPPRPDGRMWGLSAAHCVRETGQKWNARFRDGRTITFTVVNFDRRADWCWMVSDATGAKIPFAMLAERTPNVGTAIWHAGYGIDRPANREDGVLTAFENSDRQNRYRLSVSNGDSGGGIVVDSNGQVLSPVCCTSRLGGVGDVWGASPEACRSGQRERVAIDVWTPIDIPIRPPFEKEPLPHVRIPEEVKKNPK